MSSPATILLMRAAIERREYEFHMRQAKEAAALAQTVRPDGDAAEAHDTPAPAQGTEPDAEPAPAQGARRSRKRK